MPEGPPAAEKKGQQRDCQQNDRQQQIVGDRRGMQQIGIRQLVDRKSGARDDEEATAGAQQRVALLTEGQTVVSAEGNDEGDQPARDVSDQRL